MKLKFALIFFYLIISVLTVNLKKKNQKKKTNNEIKSFLRNKKKENWLYCRRPKKVGDYCEYPADCISYECKNYKCQGPEILRKVGESCLCDFHCETGHCSFSYWLIYNHNKCTTD